MTKKSILVLLSALALAGCSSSSSPGTTGGGGGDGGGGGNGTKNICPLITMADVQALVASNITGVTNPDPVVCQFADSAEGIKVEHYDNDSDLSAYNNLHLNGQGGSGTDQSISGIGDKAYWNEALDGKSPPELIAHKGNITCVIQSPDPPDTTCKSTTDQSGLPAFAPADALAYVQLMGKVCNDIFNVDTN